jgi:hypothetical protein
MCTKYCRPEHDEHSEECIKSYPHSQNCDEGNCDDCDRDYCCCQCHKVDFIKRSVDAAS